MVAMRAISEFLDAESSIKLTALLAAQDFHKDRENQRRQTNSDGVNTRTSGRSNPTLLDSRCAVSMRLQLRINASLKRTISNIKNK